MIHQPKLVVGERIPRVIDRHGAGRLAAVGVALVHGDAAEVVLERLGLLEYAQQMAAHESARTTKLYDRRNDQVTLDQVERIVL